MTMLTKMQDNLIDLLMLPNENMFVMEMKRSMMIMLLTLEHDTGYIENTTLFDDEYPTRTIGWGGHL
jgi:hypothetical protein